MNWRIIQTDNEQWYETVVSWVTFFFHPPYCVRRLHKSILFAKRDRWTKSSRMSRVEDGKILKEYWRF